MAVFPKQIADHPGKKLSIRQRPVGCGQTRIVACDKSAGNDQKKSGTGNKQRKSMHTLVHIFDIRLPIEEPPKLGASEFN
jgi:hypothetical protein